MQSKLCSSVFWIYSFCKGVDFVSFYGIQTNVITLQIRTVRPVDAGEALCIAYVDPLSCRKQRMYVLRGEFVVIFYFMTMHIRVCSQSLKEQYAFACKCARCCGGEETLDALRCFNHTCAAPVLFTFPLTQPMYHDYLHLYSRLPHMFCSKCADGCGQHSDIAAELVDMTEATSTLLDDSKLAQGKGKMQDALGLLEQGVCHG